MIPTRSLINLSKSKGFAAILVAAFIPLVMYGLSYLVKYTQESDVDTKRFEIPYVIGKNIAQSFDPGKTWDEQKDYLYSVGAQTYNAESFKIDEGMNFTVSSTVKVYRATNENKKTAIAIATANSVIKSLYDFYKNYSTEGRNLSGSKFIDNGLLVNYSPFSEFIYDEQNQSMNYFEHSEDSGEEKELVYTVNNYEKDEGKLKISLKENGNISVVCGKLNREAEVQIPRNNVDIVIAIPTNRASNTTSNSNTASFGTYTNKSTANSTPIRQIARACQAFLKPFLHTAGVAVGIVPYSGKVTLSPYSNYSDYTTQISMKDSPLSLSYAVQAMFYASDGKAGGDIIMHGSNNTVASAYGDYKNWGSSTIGLPIMARRGLLLSYRNMNLNTGNNGKTGQKSLLLDMTTNPTVGDAYKFMRMNTNPCYLGFCNTLAMTCEKDCPTYMANPYFMTELTSDIQGLIYDLELFVPFKDEKNKSNFLFLPLVMAGNIFSWGSHPSEFSDAGSEDGRVPEEAREKKDRVVIIIANAPDNFEPREMTYLGFNNDYSEIPMIESDTILFNKDRGYAVANGKYKGVKGAVQFSAQGTLEKNRGFNLNGTARISFPNKGLLRIVAEKGENSIVEVFSDNGVVDNKGKNTFSGNTTLSFRGPQQVRTYSDLGTKFKSGYYTTKGPNFGHNLSVKKVKLGLSGCKLTKATLSNQILRFYGSYSSDNGQSLIENSSNSVWSGCPANMRKRIDPCIYANYGSYYGAIDGWTFESNGTENGFNRYYIKANTFQPACYGVSRINQFICAADGFPSDGTLIPEDAQIYNSTSSNWASIGNISYNTSNGTKYRCFSSCYLYPSSLSYVWVNTGKFKINELYYYKRFASQKTRTRTLKQRITTTLNYPSTSNSGCRCCQPNNDNGGVLDNTEPVPLAGCNDMIYKHPDFRTYSQSGWTEYDATRYECRGNDLPTLYNISEYRKTITQSSNSCSYDPNSFGSSTCSYPTSTCNNPSDSGCDWISSIGNHSGWYCGLCDRSNCTGSSSSCYYSCHGSCSQTGTRDVDIPNWEERISGYKRIYACYKRKSDGSLNLTYEVCPDSNGATNCSSTTYSGSNNFDVTGILDSVRTKGVNYKVNLYNFFFVNSEEKTSTFSYSSSNTLTSKINSINDSNLLNNRGVYLLPDGSNYWVCFCGDADLQLEFQDTYAGATVSFSNIEKDLYRIAFDNTGTITNTAGVSATNIDNQQIFYVIPEQMKNTLDNGNYYVDLKISGKIRIVSVELSNRPYKLIEPSAEIVGADSNKGRAFGDGTQESVEFRTNLKTSFSFSATPIYFWLEGQSDFRQTSGTAKICGNSNKVGGCMVQAVVPDLGSGRITLTEQKYTNSRKYTITSDRKVKKIYNISEFAIPKMSLSGAVSKTYEFGAEEIASGQGSFSWSSGNFSHKPFDESITWTADTKPYEQTFSSSNRQKTINFDLKSCSLKQVYAKNLIMRFSPTENDFPSITLINRYSSCDPLRRDKSLGFYADTCNYGPSYGVGADLKWAYNQYGSGTITTYGYKNSGAATMTLYVNQNYENFSSTGTYSKSGSCTGPSVAISKVYYGGSKGGKYNYLSACEYKVSSYDLLNNKVSYTSQNTTNHNYAGSIPFYGVADIYIDVTPRKTKLTSKYSKDIPENGITGVFGNYNYSWTITNPTYALNLDSEELKRGTHFDLAYTNGTFNGTNIDAGTTRQFEGISTTTAYNGYYVKNVNVKNVVLSIPISKTHMVDGRSLATPKPGAPSSTTFTISPDTHNFELQSDGYFHVKVPCRNVYISDAKAVDASKVRVYDHLNIIKQNLINTRIIDGFDINEYESSTNARMKKYGNINYNNSSLPSVSPVQRLFYYSKPNNNEVYIYPRNSGTGSALTGEEGDFFMQLWDHNNEVPAVRWKIGSLIQSSTTNINLTNSGFGAFKSNYAFNGLHRMFFPYDVYNKDYAGYSYAMNSALVFAGYTLPINLILASNGYQQTYSLASGSVSSYTKPNTALSNLAKDACSKLQTGLNTAIFLVKYRTNSTLSLESCVDKNQQFTVNNEADLIKKMKEIAVIVKELSKKQELVINVKDIK
jgi:hypothetical protein